MAEDPRALQWCWSCDDDFNSLRRCLHIKHDMLCSPPIYYTGEVNLAGLSLKRAALDGLDLPIDVKEGVYLQLVCDHPTDRESIWFYQLGCLF